MDPMAPATVTPGDIRDLVIASRKCEAALSIVKGTDIVVVGPAATAETNPNLRIVQRAGELRTLLSTITKHVERLYRDDVTLTWEGMALAATLINKRISAVLEDGTAVQVTE